MNMPSIAHSQLGVFDGGWLHVSPSAHSSYDSSWLVLDDALEGLLHGLNNSASLEISDISEIDIR